MPFHVKLVRGASIAIAAAILLATLAAAAPAANGAESVVVMLAEGATMNDVAKGHGVSGWRLLDKGTYLVETTDARGLAAERKVVAVETDETIRAAQVGWDSASWDTASWNTASWDTASWNTASWDTASWNTASWNTALWDTASWNTASWNTASWNTASWNTASWNIALDDGTFVDPTWGRVAIQAPDDVRPGATTVCIADSGIDAAHPQLASTLWRGPAGEYGIDLVDRDALPEDTSGHGTHLAGIIAATTDGPMRGVGAPLLASAKIFGADGIGLSSTLIEAVSWCTDIGADVILLALTEDSPSKALRETLMRAQRSGSAIVASAGNNGPCTGCVSYPAAYPGVLAVGAIASDGTPSSFSSAGTEVDLVAPGVRILSTYPGGYRIGSGTSQAAAYAAGALALLDQGPRGPTLLMQTALDLERPGDDPLTGRGLLQLSAARTIL